MSLASITRCLAIVGATALPAAGVHAGMIGFDLSVDQIQDGNQAYIFLTNTSDSEKIEKVDFFIGNTAFNFDASRILAGSNDVGASLLSPDANFSGGDGPNARSDNVVWSFTGFDPGESFNFWAEVDLDTNPNQFIDFRTFIWPSGTLSLTFEGGDTLVHAFTAQFLTPSSYSVSGTSRAGDVPTEPTPNVVPLPAGLPLLLAGLAALGIVKRRSRA